jgi:hypothetical protein
VEARFSAPNQTGPETHPSSAKVKERVDLYLPLWTFMACYKENFHAVKKASLITHLSYVRIFHYAF